MACLSAEELEARYTDTAFRERFLRVFAIREFYKHAVRPKSYSPPRVSEWLRLTDAGESVIQRIQQVDSEILHENAMFCVLLLLHHQELLCDVENSNLEAMISSLSDGVVSGTLRYPWLFDHILYDKAFELFPNKPENLTSGDTGTLLTGTPQGVFQVGELVAGPLGVLKSRASRFFAPLLDLPLWHCDDRMCGAIHVGRLRQTDEHHLEIVSKTRKWLVEEEGPASEWYRFGRQLLIKHHWYDDFSFANLPWILGNAFSHAELTQITSRVLRRLGSEVREELANVRGFQDLFRGSPEDIAAQCSKPHALQVMLLAEDAQIVASIEELIEQKAIKIPTSEKRHPQASAPLPSWAGAYCECSDLGVRVIGNDRASNPLARLKRLILSLFPSDSDQEELNWVVRTADGKTLGQKLERFMEATSPAEIVDRIVLASPSRLRKALEHVKARYLSLPRNAGEEARLREVILWKLGFARQTFDSPLRLFYEGLKNFHDIAASNGASLEDWRAEVRSEGVNLFVYLEEILELALAFATWMLLSDHSMEGHLYNPNAGRVLMARELSGVISTDRGDINYDSAKRNTLFPLVHGFKALHRRIQQVLSMPLDAVLKPPILLAHYAHESSLQIYPYKHRHFVLDMASGDRDQCLSLMLATTEQLERSNLLDVRNRVDHYAETFPRAEEVTRCCDLVSGAIRRLEEGGYIPSLFATVRIEVDGYGRELVTSRSYSGAHLRWWRSPSLKAVRSLPNPREPQVLVPSICVPESNEILRFRMQEDSAFTELWKDYPKWTSEPLPADASDTLGATQAN